MKFNTVITLFIFLSAVATSFGQGSNTTALSVPDSLSHLVSQHEFYYHRQIVSFSPIQFSENGVGFGVGYEKGIDKMDVVALTLPAVITFDMSNRSTTNTYAKSEPSYNAMYYIMPGIKFYPLGSRERVCYSVGTNIVIGDGAVTENISGVDYKRNRFVIGPLINTGLNINPTEHFYMGLEFGMGFTYFHVINSENRGSRFLTQGGFKIGYRF